MHKQAEKVKNHSLQLSLFASAVGIYPKYIYKPIAFGYIMYPMIPMRIIVTYIRWHFGIAIREIFEWYKNLSWFGYHFFSIPLLLKTLIRPIYRIHESARPGTGLNVELFFENLAVNVAARIIGFFLRIFLIICGGIYQLIFLFLAPIFLLVWFVIPLIPFALVIMGIYMVSS